MRFNFFKYGGVFSGDHKGMRYRIGRIGEKPDFILQAAVWPEPFSFEKTKEEEKVFADFPYSEEGRDQAVIWIQGQYEAQKMRWDHVPTLYDAVHTKSEYI